jgi:hypothetical protein
MGTLRQAAAAAKGELWQLDSIELDKVEVKDKTFSKTEKGEDGKEIKRDVSYKVLIVDSKEYTIRDKQLNQIKELLLTKPTTKRVRFMKLDGGSIVCLGLD